MKPEAFRINLTKLMMEPGERRELRVSPRTGADGNSAMRVEFTFAPPNSRPDQLLKEAKAKDPSSVANIRIPIRFQAGSPAASGGGGSARGPPPPPSTHAPAPASEPVPEPVPAAEPPLVSARQQQPASESRCLTNSTQEPIEDANKDKPAPADEV